MDESDNPIAALFMVMGFTCAVSKGTTFRTAFR
jgi:hypothetical protein